MRSAIDFMKAVATIVAGLIVLVFIILIVVAEVSCPIPGCRGAGGDVWMLPFVYSFVGIPSLLLLIAMFFLKRRR